MLRSVNEKAGLSVGFESLYKSLDEDYEYKYRQYPLEIRLELGRKTDAGTLIDLGNILIKAPAPLADAKQQIDKRADRQKQVRHEEVLGIEHIPAADKMQIAPDIIAEYARQAQQRKKNEVYCNRLLAAQAEGIHAYGNDILENRKHSGKACKDHEQEEQRAPEAAAGHVDKHLRQSNKYQRRSLLGRHAEREAGREDDRSCHERNEGIQCADACSLTRERVLIAHVAAEYLHCRNAEAEGEKRLVHSVRDEASEAVFADGAGICASGFCRVP